ncbi:accessory Sec system protein Asp1 [Streptococcus sp. 10F2]
MFYFIPSWYNANRPWYHQTQIWFRVLERMTFDDTVHQIKMFHQGQEEVGLLILNYQPQLRYLLHKQDLLAIPYWSFFDDIQNISSVSVKPFSFKELHWPKGTQFLYSPFAVLARVNQKDIARIHFAQDGNLFFIEFLEDGKVSKQYLFDDRGFLSSILYFDEQEQEWYQDYLNESGVWQVREYLQGSLEGQIEVNPYADHLFQQKFYQSWSSLMEERLELLKQQVMDDQDTLVIASHSQHNELMLQVFPKQQKVVSFFGDRFQFEVEDSSQKLVEQANLLVVDTKKQEEKLRQWMQVVYQQPKALLRVPPYDTRLRLGHSQMIKEQILYFYMDSLTESELFLVLEVLLDFMAQHDDVALSLVTFDRSRNTKIVEEWISQRIYSHYNAEDFFQVADTGNENQLEEDEEMELSRIHFHLLTNENDIITALDSARLVLDLGVEPDLYTQIASISAGVPQINQVETDFVSHKKNGWILHPEENLEEALHFYLEGLANWNRSLVYSVQKMADYTSGRILHQWHELLDKEERT